MLGFALDATSTAASAIERLHITTGLQLQNSSVSKEKGS